MNEISVHIGEVKIARNGETLSALLGSCVGIGLIWKEGRVSGLAHCLLPEAPQPTFVIGGRFVTQAIPSLLAMMKIQPEQYAQLIAVLVGGGNMTQPEHAVQLVGTSNVRVAEAELGRRGIAITHRETGGPLGRRVSIRSDVGTFEIEKIPRLAATGSGAQ